MFLTSKTPRMVEDTLFCVSKSFFLHYQTTTASLTCLNNFPRRCMSLAFAVLLSFYIWFIWFVHGFLILALKAYYHAEFSSIDQKHLNKLLKGCFYFSYLVSCSIHYNTQLIQWIIIALVHRNRVEGFVQPLLWDWLCVLISYCPIKAHFKGFAGKCGQFVPC